MEDIEVIKITNAEKAKENALLDQLRLLLPTFFERSALGQGIILNYKQSQMFNALENRIKRDAAGIIRQLRGRGLINKRAPRIGKINQILPTVSFCASAPDTKTKIKVNPTQTAALAEFIQDFFLRLDKRKNQTADGSKQIKELLADPANPKGKKIRRQRRQNCNKAIAFRNSLPDEVLSEMNARAGRQGGYARAAKYKKTRNE